MTPVEKIYNEEITNRSVMILRPEGLFFRAYERSAFLVCKTVKDFKTTKRHFKKIGQEIVSIGFPKDTFEKYIGNRTVTFDIDGTARVKSDIELDESLFLSWKQSIPLTSVRDLHPSIEGDRTQVYSVSYALLVQIFESVVNIQRDYKNVPGTDLMKCAVGLVRSVLKANDARDYAKRLEEINRAIVLVDDIKLFLRVLVDLRQISPGKYMMLSQMSVSISGQLKAWATKTYDNQKQ